jgi:hypothetical protein
VVLPVEFIPIPGARERFAARENVAVARRFGFQREYLLPVDGHPNGAGNRAYATAIVEAMQTLPQLRTVFVPRASAP